MQFKDLAFHVSQTQSFVDYGNTKITRHALKEETLFYFLRMLMLDFIRMKKNPRSYTFLCYTQHCVIYKYITGGLKDEPISGQNWPIRWLSALQKTSIHFSQ